MDQMEKRWWRVFWVSFTIFFVSGLVEIVFRHVSGVAVARRILFVDALVINLAMAAGFVALHRISPIVIEKRWKRTGMDFIASCAFLLVVPLPHALMYIGPKAREYKLYAFAAACLFVIYLAFLLFWSLRQTARRNRRQQQERNALADGILKSAEDVRASIRILRGDDKSN